MKIGFTGTQQGLTPAQKKTLAYLLVTLSPEQFHHGDCIGADEEAHNLATGLHIPITIHPPDNSTRRAWCRGGIMCDPAPYLARNHAIVDEAELLLATPDGEVEKMRSGTWATIRYARKKGIPVRIILPGGNIHDENSHHKKESVSKR
jgi:hypothetical protein